MGGALWGVRELRGHRVFFGQVCLMACLGLTACKTRPPVDDQGANELAGDTAAKPTWAPLPFEDRAKGRNNNAYEPYIGEKDEQAFLAKTKVAALQTCREYKIPASAIVGMAIAESGYGSTRLAWNANNYFSTKVWGKNPPNSWQLQGQPDESAGSQDPTKVKERLGADRLIFDEVNRADNRYRAFQTPVESFRYLAEAFLKRPNKAGQKKGYIDGANRWLKTVTANQAAIPEASKQYLYDISEAGYCHLGGEYYRKKIGPIMDKHKLYDLDKECLTAAPLPTDLLTINDIKVFPTVDADDMTVKGMVNIQVKVTDEGSGVNRVEFYAHQEDGKEGSETMKATDTLIATLTKPTDTVDSVFLVPWDTTKAGPDGSYNIIVQAYDNAVDPATGKSAPTFRMKSRGVVLKNGKNASKAPVPATGGSTGSGTSASTSKPVNGNFGSCKSNGRAGSCIDKAYCQGGTPVAGQCSGPASVMCCVWN